jgi:hypothetical protein
VQKARVSTEGVKVVALLSECVGARGAESETYFESALRDAQLIPGLEGSTHINFGQTAQFAAPYFAGGADPLPAERRDGENPYWFRSRDRNAKTVRFADWRAPYAPLGNLPNVAVFERQAAAFGRFVRSARRVPNPVVKLGIGRCFSVVAFAQLVAEDPATRDAEPALVSLVFHSLVADLAAEALRLAAALPPGDASRAVLRRAARVPATVTADYEAVAALIDCRFRA